MSVSLSHSNYTLWKYVIFFIYINVLVKDALTGYPFNLTINIRYIDDFIIMIIFFLGLLSIVLKQTQYLSKIYMFLFVFILWGLVTTGFDFKRVMLGFRDTFWYISVPISTILLLKKSELLNAKIYIIKLILIFIYAQIAYFIFQESVFILSNHNLLIEDDVTGTLGKGMAHVLSYSLLMTIPVLYLSHLKTGRKKLLVFFILIIVISASARAAILFSVISWGGYIALARTGLHLKGFFLLLVKLLILLVLMSLIATLYTYLFPNMVMNLDVLWYQHSRGLYEHDEFSGSRKFAVFLFGLSFLQGYSEIIFGAGPASFASRGASYVDGNFQSLFNSYFPFKNEMIASSSQFTVFLVDYGVLGTLVFIIFPLFYFLWMSKKYEPQAIFSLLIFILGCLANKLFETYSTVFLLNLLFTLIYIDSIFLKKRSSILGRLEKPVLIRK